MLDEAKKLYDLGFALLWLHPKEKRPIENAWTKGPRTSWEQLKKTYRPGYNVGVRTGSASKIGENYLAVIDVDLKSQEFKSKAQAQIKELIGNTKCPIVMSGSGNGSHHLYCVTKKPFKMKTVLKEKEGEICIYSEGRQMVLPPSQTIKPYKWVTGAVSKIPLLEFEIEDSPVGGATAPKKTSTGLPRDINFTFTAEPVDLGWLELSDEIRNAIVLGAGVSDRSGFLLRASNALMAAGLTQNEVLSVLTDPKFYLGRCAYDHAKTSDRERAAYWVYRYTLQKIATERSEVSAKNVFTRVQEMKPDRILSKAEAQEQFEGLALDTKTAVEEAKENGFYLIGKKGGVTPLYNELMEYFSEVTPFKTIADMKAVYGFNGTHYEHLTPIHIRAFAEANFNPKPNDKIRSEFLNKVLANNIASRDFFLRATEGRINFKNGVLDLNSESDRLLEHSPEFGFRGVLPYDYDDKARAPIFNKWIHDVLLGDESLLCVVQEFMGYIVRGGEYKYHKALWLGGRGRNGKSTFVDLLKALIGAGNYSTISIKSLVGDRFVGADLDGKMANFSEETSPEELKDSGPFKNLTGDGDISAQKKYGDPFHFRNRAKLVMTYNEIPDLKDLSQGMLSRPLIIPFKKIIKEGQQDRSIKKKLFSELSGIFNFALAGWRRLEEQNGFTESQASIDALDIVKKESCNVYQWAENCVKFLKPGEVSSKESRRYTPTELWIAYRGHEKHSYGFTTFAKRVLRHPKMSERHKRFNEGWRYFDMEI